LLCQFSRRTFEIIIEQEREAATKNQHLYSNPVIESILNLVLNLNGGTTHDTPGLAPCVLKHTDIRCTHPLCTGIRTRIPYKVPRVF
jgi:hypothetical protein